jgi:hypothetical protein
MGNALNDTSIVTEVAEAKEHDDPRPDNNSDEAGGAQYRTL